MASVFDIDTTSVPPNRPYLRKAKENYLCAQKAMQSGWHNAAVSRAYYAMFLAAVEYMKICRQTPRRPHPISGGWQKGELAYQVGQCSGNRMLKRYLRTAKLLRETADYGDVSLDASQAGTECRNAHDFLSFAVQKAI